jgi:hypothetical protein
VLDAFSKVQRRVGWGGGIIVYSRDRTRYPAGVIWHAGGADVGRKAAEL